METNCNSHIEKEDHHVGDDSSKVQLMMAKWGIPLFFYIFYCFAVAHDEESLNGVHLRNF